MLLASDSERLNDWWTSLSYSFLVGKGRLTPLSSSLLVGKECLTSLSLSFAVCKEWLISLSLSFAVCKEWLISLSLSFAVCKEWLFSLSFLFLIFNEWLFSCLRSFLVCVSFLFSFSASVSLSFVSLSSVWVCFPSDDSFSSRKFEYSIVFSENSIGGISGYETIEFCSWRLSFIWTPGFCFFDFCVGYLIVSLF